MPHSAVDLERHAAERGHGVDHEQSGMIASPDRLADRLDIVIGAGRAPVSADSRNSAGALPLDFDGDGKLDLYVIRYWSALDLFHLKSPEVWIENTFDARNGGTNTLYRNRGDGSFEDVTASAGGGDRHWSYDAAVLKSRKRNALAAGGERLEAGYPYSIQDGKLQDVSTKLGIPDRRQGMNVSLADLSGDGIPHVFVSNTWQAWFQHLDNFLWRFKPGTIGAGDDQARERGLDGDLPVLRSVGVAIEPAFPRLVVAGPDGLRLEAPQKIIEVLKPSLPGVGDEDVWNSVAAQIGQRDVHPLAAVENPSFVETSWSFPSWIE